MLHKVRDLPNEARGVVESLIGRRLTDDESFSIRPVRLIKEGADTASANVVADKLEAYFAEIDRQHPPLSPEEAEATMDEAMRHVRPGYTRIR
ncbi:MAG: hypothetical protein U0Q16_25425 [Bryobacteraceae bacterium]